MQKSNKNGIFVARLKNSNCLYFYIQVAPSKTRNAVFLFFSNTFLLSRKINFSLTLFPFTLDGLGHNRLKTEDFCLLLCYCQCFLWITVHLPNHICSSTNDHLRLKVHFPGIFQLILDDHTTLWKTLQLQVPHDMCRSFTSHKHNHWSIWLGSHVIFHV